MTLTAEPHSATDSPGGISPNGHGGGHGDPDHGGHVETSGILKWLTSTDHKVIGKSYTITSIVLFLLAGFMALLIRTQLSHPGNTFLSQ
ncbi:MAG TPA: hypothetical protein VMU77_06375, partial [Acidimicrobiales bacterium]|nr:hypothetical protein [Acidimicrobiales bacterium]